MGRQLYKTHGFHSELERVHMWAPKHAHVSTKRPANITLTSRISHIIYILLATTKSNSTGTRPAIGTRTYWHKHGSHRWIGACRRRLRSRPLRPATGLLLTGRNSQPRKEPSAAVPSQVTATTGPDSEHVGTFVLFQTFSRSLHSH